MEFTRWPLKFRRRRRLPAKIQEPDFADQLLELEFGDLLDCIAGRLQEVWRESRHRTQRETEADWTLCAVALVRLGDLIEDKKRERKRHQAA